MSALGQNRTLNASLRCPLYPQKRTLARLSDHLTGFPQPTKPSPQSDDPSVNRPGMCAMRELMPSAGFVPRVREKTCGDVNVKKRSCCGGVSATRCDVHRNCRKNFRPQKQTCTSKDGGCLADAGRTSREE